MKKATLAETSILLLKSKSQSICTGNFRGDKLKKIHTRRKTHDCLLGQASGTALRHQFFSSSYFIIWVHFHLLSFNFATPPLTTTSHKVRFSVLPSLTHIHKHATDTCTDSWTDLRAQAVFGIYNYSERILEERENGEKKVYRGTSLKKFLIVRKLEICTKLYLYYVTYIPTQWQCCCCMSPWFEQLLLMHEEDIYIYIIGTFQSMLYVFEFIHFAIWPLL